MRKIVVMTMFARAFLCTAIFMFNGATYAASTVTGSVGVLKSAPEFNGALSYDSVASNCKQSSLDTDPLTKIAYFLVEPNTPATRCKLEVWSGSKIADVVTLGGPAVVYVNASGSYMVGVSDLSAGSTALSFVSVSGEPKLPVRSEGAASVAGCSSDLQRRSVAGINNNYSGGWKINTNIGAANCTKTNQTSEIMANAVEIAVQEDFDLKIQKSLTTANTPVAGDTVQYKFLVTNNGGIPWTLIVNDTLSGISSISCLLNPLPAGGSTTCEAAYNITASDVSTGRIINSATVSGIDNQRANSTGAKVTTSASSVSLPLGKKIDATAVPTLNPGALAGLVALLLFGARKKIGKPKKGKD